MELFLSRAMDVSRVNSEEIIKLHVFEKNAKRVLMSFEIQNLLGLCPIKEALEIPSDHESSQGSHSQRIKSELRAHGLIPKYGDFISTDLDDIHNFDERIRILADQMKIDFKFRSSKGGRRKISEELEVVQ